MNGLILAFFSIIIIFGMGAHKLYREILAYDCETKQEITINNVKYKCEVSDERYRIKNRHDS